MTRKSRKNSCFEVLDGLFCELEASSVTSGSGLDPDPDPYWPPSGSSGSGSVKN
jgi:hypothetical protein